MPLKNGGFKFKNPKETSPAQKPLPAVDDGFLWIESFNNLEGPLGQSLPSFSREYRLDRMEFLARGLGNPEKAGRFIHVAGSKGKGSTALCLALGLGALLKTANIGLYASPHIHSYKERITLSGKEIQDSYFINNFSLLKNYLSGLEAKDIPGGSPPTTFELLTLLAFLIFKDLGCPWTVLETGLGGRLDATNIVDPAASVITTIELEHTEFLGNTLAAIAGEKGGIIKPGRPVFAGFLAGEALEVLRKTAEEKSAPLSLLSSAVRLEQRFRRRGGKKRLLTRLTWLEGPPPRRETWALPGGLHQGPNAALAALVLRSLFPREARRRRGALRKALGRAALPGRMEFLKTRRGQVVLDGAHTPESLALTVGSFTRLFGEGQTLIFGAVQGKNIEALAAAALPHFSRIIIARAGHFKPEDPEKVFAAFSRAASAAPAGAALYLEADPLKALALALPPPSLPRQRRGHKPGRGEGRAALVAGSFYLLPEIRRACRKGSF
ncbi:MAG: bifunctional folylpolyglutamate synthase/dihydrofolate synthase [Spirochaetales bacterium]|nr:bifunctional folylpolyglutamate synthase/dihydrofolate synthase [Spirochaetales bacterium]